MKMPKGRRLASRALTQRPPRTWHRRLHEVGRGIDRDELRAMTSSTVVNVATRLGSSVTVRLIPITAVNSNPGSTGSPRRTASLRSSDHQGIAPVCDGLGTQG